MNSSKITVHRKLQRDNPLPEKAKILKDINKITQKPLKVFASCPVQRVGISNIGVDVRQVTAKKEFDKVIKAFRSVASQTTVGAQNEYEGVVRYPSSRKHESRPKREVGLQVETASPRGETPRRSHSFVDHIRLNQFPVIKPKLAASARRIDPCRAPPTYVKGIIPKYLQKLKEQEEKEGLGNKIETSTSTMKDKDSEERELKLKKLASWHDSYKKMVSELNMLSAAS